MQQSEKRGGIPQSGTARAAVSLFLEKSHSAVSEKARAHSVGLVRHLVPAELVLGVAALVLEVHLHAPPLALQAEMVEFQDLAD